MSDKLVSVIIPSYNHQNYVSDSVLSVLNQNYPNLELIVLDDGSKDNSSRILEGLNSKHHFKLILKSNEGLCATINQGLKLAKGEYIVIFASDDLMTPNRIREQVDLLDKNSSFDVVAGGMNLINAEGEFLETKEPITLGEISLVEMFRRNVIFAPTAMIRRRVYDKVGTYRPDYSIEDYYLWLKLLKSGGVIYNSFNIWANYRLDNNNYERKFIWYYQGYTQILQDYLPSKKIAWLIARAQIIFSIKMGLQLGKMAFSKYPNHVSNLPFTMKAIILSVSLLPMNIRHRILNFALKKI